MAKFTRKIKKNIDAPRIAAEEEAKDIAASQRSMAEAEENLRFANLTISNFAPGKSTSSPVSWP